MTAIQFPPLVCKSCKGTGRWDVGTEDEGPCRADYCEEGTIMCASCSDNSGASEPAVGEFFIWLDRAREDHAIPLCRMHLERAHAAEAEEGRGDYERDMRKHGDL